jgi:hypothetical protein
LAGDQFSFINNRFPPRWRVPESLNDYTGAIDRVIDEFSPARIALLRGIKFFAIMAFHELRRNLSTARWVRFEEEDG